MPDISEGTVGTEILVFSILYHAAAAAIATVRALPPGRPPGPPYFIDVITHFYAYMTLDDFRDIMMVFKY